MLYKYANYFCVKHFCIVLGGSFVAVSNHSTAFSTLSLLYAIFLILCGFSCFCS